MKGPEESRGKGLSVFWVGKLSDLSRKTERLRRRENCAGAKSIGS
jgi:hypothetical protein